MFDWKNIYYVRTNVSRKRSAISDVDRKTLALIEKYNELDIELYRFVAGQFKETIASAGDGYLNQLTRLQKANSLYKPVAFLKRIGSYARRILS